MNARADRLTVSGAVVVTAAAIAFLTQRQVTSVKFAVAFGVFMLAGEIARVALPYRRIAAPLFLAGGTGFALTTHMGGTHVQNAPWLVITVAAAAAAVGSTIHALGGRQARSVEVSRRVLVVAFVALLAWWSRGQLGSSVKGDFVAASIAVVGGCTDIVSSGIRRAALAKSSWTLAIHDEVRTAGLLASATVATGLLIALSAPVMGIWSLPVLSMPLLATQYSFKRHSAIRATYRQTIRALSRVTEVGGYVEGGHADRVSELAVRIGRELGMGESALLDLEYAALLHDIGQLSVNQPVPGGATLLLANDERRRIAHLGGKVVRNTGVLTGVARIVEHQADPPVPSVPMASRIISVASAYDDLVTCGVAENREGVLSHLWAGVPDRYDPRVVAALDAVLQTPAPVDVAGATQ